MKKYQFLIFFIFFAYMRFSNGTFLQKEKSLEINYQLISEIPITYMWLNNEKIKLF